MSKSFFYPFKYSGGVKDVHTLDSSKLLQVVGGNVGNLAFQYPMQLLFNESLTPWVYADNKENSSLIVTAANWIEEKETAPFSEAFAQEALSYKNLLIYGLGAQAKLGVSAEEYSNQLPSSLIERLREVLTNVASFGVRDAFTQKVLANIGITNAKVLGCSSIFMNPSPELGLLVQNKCSKLASLEENEIRVTLNEFTHNAKSRSLTRRDLNANIKFLKSRYSHYLLQGRHSIACYFGEKDSVDNIISDFISTEDSEFFYDVLRNKSVLFTDIPNWLSYYRTRDLVVGTRIHGAILSLQAGTPTVLVTHDSRTKGLAEVLCIPSLTAEEFAKNEYKNHELIKVCKEQLTNFDVNRSKLASMWKGLFVDNGFLMSDHIDKIALFGENF